MRASGPVVLLGPPGAGCSSVGHALAQTTGRVLTDLRTTVARELGVHPSTALVEVPEERYREAEARCACAALREAEDQFPAAVLALGSGCLDRDEVRAAVGRIRGAGGCVVALLARARALAARNGLDAPRSIALGDVHRQFTRMLRQREQACRELADVVVDTTGTTPCQAAEQVVQRCAAAAGS
ncbi:shikimate kinase [Actinomyces sp. 2119]|uniref:Shikimate kinase n=1 Tax=Actinomyces lilanjuaniae TaxID=2321394 RepID=A0ABM6Z350_9ACTO|nr:MULTISPECIES: shikimate kinase [Actinomyces]AYD89760.1 shikimate kinase [Actinomyces lilanjuaniae]RJF44729.1 shikimate kinase [Actinomyces sp. 2119]